MNPETDSLLQFRIHPAERRPILVYLPGLHGDWTLSAPLRRCLAGQLAFAEICYPQACQWSAQDYAEAVLHQLEQHGISRAWILGESFGSQIAWALFDASIARPAFTPLGLILAGGFVRHPWPAAARAGVRLLSAMPDCLQRCLPRLYATTVRLRHRRSPPLQAALRAFVNRRTTLDRQAMVQRLRLVAENDPRPSARRVVQPVYQLAGFFDPLVPTPVVRRWLQIHCPGFRQSVTLPRADHHVLLSAPQASARHILQWIHLNPEIPCQHPEGD